jgi:hypothetical protein
MKKALRLRGMYVLGARGCRKTWLLGQLLSLQDNRTDIPLLIRDPRGQPNAIDLYKEEAGDASKMVNDSTQPEA